MGGILLLLMTGPPLSTGAAEPPGADERLEDSPSTATDSPQGMTEERESSGTRGWRPRDVHLRPVLTNLSQAVALGREGARATPHRVDFQAVLTMQTADRSF